MAIYQLISRTHAQSIDSQPSQLSKQPCNKTMTAHFIQITMAENKTFLTEWDLLGEAPKRLRMRGKRRIFGVTTGTSWNPMCDLFFYRRNEDFAAESQFIK